MFASFSDLNILNAFVTSKEVQSSGLTPTDVSTIRGGVARGCRGGGGGASSAGVTALSAPLGRRTTPRATGSTPSRAATGRRSPLDAAPPVSGVSAGSPGLFNSGPRASAVLLADALARAGLGNVPIRTPPLLVGTTAYRHSPGVSV